ncbi:MAG: c-type cytochrome domain-containing protein, partial [Phycisphaeraceae bacterium]
MLERRWLSVVTGIAVVAAVAWPAAADEPEKLSYTHDVKPILMDSCLACHGADADGRKAGLRLDDRMAAIEAGAIVPGDAEASEAVLRIF